MQPVILKLYVCGEAQTSEQAIANLRQLLADYPRFECELRIIDVLERPDLAEADDIMATPTLLKVSPAPRQLLVGDLSNCDTVKRALGITDTTEES